jgi:hypothetical protein
MKMALKYGLTAWLAVAAVLPLWAADEGVHISSITDEDGDEAILMESEWISMHLLPWRQSLINRFVFTPTGNDIVEPTNPKIRMAGGGGILMDCFWEQDWRFQELAYKPYKYQILKTGPEEAQITFETDIKGWLAANDSGIISKLFSNLTLRRTVTLKRGQPFFRFDFEFVNNDTFAKRPTFWIHNGSFISRDITDTMIRPSARGLSAIGGGQADYPAWPQAEDFIRDFNQGWTANIHAGRKEGVVYLMDYDYVDTLYNCGNTTTEWFYDSILVPKDKAWRGHVYILPTIGLSGVDFACEHFICELRPKREGDQVTLDYQVTSSYEECARVTFITEVESDLNGTASRKQKLEPLIMDGLAIQPASGKASGTIAGSDPLVFNISAMVELPDGSVKKYAFQKFFTGNYKLKVNEAGLLGEGKPVRLLDRAIRKPRLPDLPAGITINKNAFNVFGVLGFGSFRLGYEEAFKLIPKGNLEIGFCVGNDAAQNGLSDFPYDYDRLFNNRVLLLSNIQDKEFRRIGASIMLPWLKAGGGLVLTGGNYAFTYELEEHEINAYYPIPVTPKSLRRGPLQLEKPADPNHPIFRGVDLTSLPYMHFWHDVSLKTNSPGKVLMTVGGHPFIVEQKTGDQITMVVAVNGYGCDEEFPGKTPVRLWKEWPKLMANIIRYAGHDLQ